ncbi:EAL domain-containing protein [Vibrio sp. MA40-2]|uniref:sensor domain-containing protein n=1 Tax=Vibrio sp. MA40-2 TaxID=3391828 RepID=UPI0039A4FAC9
MQISRTSLISLAAFAIIYAWTVISSRFSIEHSEQLLIWYPAVLVGIIISHVRTALWLFAAVLVVMSVFAYSMLSTLESSISFALVVSSMFDCFMVAYFCRFHLNLKQILIDFREFTRLFVCFSVIIPLFGFVVFNLFNYLGSDWVSFELLYVNSLIKVYVTVSLLPLTLLLLNVEAKGLITKLLSPLSVIAITSVIVLCFVTIEYESNFLTFLFVALIAIAFLSFESTAMSILGGSLIIGHHYFDVAVLTAYHQDVAIYSLIFGVVTLIAMYLRVQRDNLCEARYREEQFIDIYHKTPAALHSIDASGSIVAVSDKWLQLFGYERSEVLGKKSSEFLTEESNKKAIESILPSFFENGHVEDVEYQFVHSCGKIIDVELSGILITENNTQKSYAVLQDISNAKKLARDLFEEKEMLETMLMSMGDGVIATDKVGNITLINSVAELLTGVDSETAIGKRFESVVELTDGNNGKALYNPIQLALNERTTVGVPETTRLKSKTGDIFEIQDSVAPIYSSNNEITGAIMVFQDVTESRNVSEKMSYLAQHDMLTDLPNRVLLTDRLNLACAYYERTQTPFTLLFMDLDNFKTLNDTMGHTVGDQALKIIAKRLKPQFRKTDTLSRIGGDEFVVLLEGEMNLLNISKTCKSILEEVSRPIFFDKQEFVLSASIGVASCPKDGSDAETIMRRSDVAMYRAKDLGRNRFNLYSRKLESAMNERLELESKLRQAIASDQMQLFYQPIVNAQNSEIVYAEALCRWREKEGNFVSPDVFIPLAEETGLIIELGEKIIRQACKDFIYVIRKGSSPFSKLSVNISAVQLNHIGFLNMVNKIFNEEEVAPSWFIFEITETSIMTNPKKSLSVLTELKGLGVSIAIDDFGTGYSSLSHLKNFPVDILKIDKEFVNNIEQGGQEEAFVDAMVKMAKTLNINVVAEGVENCHQASILNELGTDYLQGYYYSKPSELSNYILSEGDVTEKVLA